MKERYYHEEEHFHSRDRKRFKKERRAAQKGDRSKFKKSDLDQMKKAEPSLPSDNPDLRTGRVIAITGEGILVDVEGKQLLCTLKGLMKKEKMKAKNLIAIGDLVRVLPETGSIEHIEERYSTLSRQDITGTKEQLIAVNIDQVLIIASVGSPPLKPALIDRYLISAELGRMHPIIVINKIDLLEEIAAKEREFYRTFLADYERIGYPILSVSTQTGVGMDNLRAIMQNKATVISGQSGVGKSSLLNSAFGFDLKIGDLAQKTSKGSHTTTTAQLIRLPQGGFCIDTPGIRSFGIWNLQQGDLIDHYREFIPFAKECRYPNCTHLKEPACEVRKAVENKLISSIRFETYRSLMEEIIEGIDRRTKRKMRPLDE
jgi:ribosome biogenesis GTPase / thiamine phosphate phosphatase